MKNFTPRMNFLLFALLASLMVLIGYIDDGIDANHKSNCELVKDGTWPEKSGVCKNAK
jgi:hypothetical protein